MSKHSDDRPAKLANLDPRVPSTLTESGELERPSPRRRIDCDGNPEVSDRRRGSRGVGASGATYRSHG